MRFYAGAIAAAVAGVLLTSGLHANPLESPQLPCRSKCKKALPSYGSCLVNEADTASGGAGGYRVERCRKKARACLANRTPKCEKSVARCVMKGQGGKPPIHPASCHLTYKQEAEQLCKCEVELPKASPEPSEGQ